MKKIFYLATEKPGNTIIPARATFFNRNSDWVNFMTIMRGLYKHINLDPKAGITTIMKIQNVIAKEVLRKWARSINWHRKMCNVYLDSFIKCEHYFSSINSGKNS
jgi:hypothetical protein